MVRVFGLTSQPHEVPRSRECGGVAALANQRACGTLVLQTMAVKPFPKSVLRLFSALHRPS